MLKTRPGETVIIAGEVIDTWYEANAWRGSREVHYPGYRKVFEVETREGHFTGPIPKGLEETQAEDYVRFTAAVREDGRFTRPRKAEYLYRPFEWIDDEERCEAALDRLVSEGLLEG